MVKMQRSIKATSRESTFQQHAYGTLKNHICSYFHSEPFLPTLMVASDHLFPFLPVTARFKTTPIFKQHWIYPFDTIVVYAAVVRNYLAFLFKT